MAELLGGAAIGATYAEVQRLIIETISLNRRFRSELNRLKATMESLAPIVEEAKRLEEQPAGSGKTDPSSSFRQNQIFQFLEKLREAKELIVKCSELHSWDVRKRSKCCRRLLEVDNDLLRCMHVAWTQAAYVDTRKTRQLTEEIIRKVDEVRAWTMELANVPKAQETEKQEEAMELSWKSRKGKEQKMVEGESVPRQFNATEWLQHGVAYLQRPIEEKKAQLREVHNHSNAKNWSTNPRVLEYTLVELQAATQNFNCSLIVGVGGSSHVYKAQLRGATVAIKHFAEGFKSDEFTREVEILSQVMHPNIVNLLGVCNGGKKIGDMCLVLEWIPNGNLLHHLSGHGGRSPLPWPARLRIAKEICGALLWLQSAVKPRSVFHGDIKPDNIILDDKLNAKLCDFGTSKIARHIKCIEGDVTYLAEESTVRGTPNYVDPYYVKKRTYTSKSDLYGFGVVLLQLFTGFHSETKVTGPRGDVRGCEQIVNEVESYHSKHKLLDLKDQRPECSPEDKTLVLADLGMRCCRADPRDRPNLETVWTELQNAVSDKKHALFRFSCHL